MTYDQVTALFLDMDNLETYSKLYQQEFSKDEPDWESVDRYKGYIKDHRRAIFDITQLHGS